MRLLTVPPRQGALWVRRGITVFARAPLAFASLLGIMLLGAMLLSLVPVLGVAAMLAAPPLVSLGFMIATREVLAGNRRPTPRVFIEPLRGERAKVVAMLKLCASYALLFALSVAIANWTSDGQLSALATAGNAKPEELEAIFERGGLLGSIVLCASLLTLLSLAFWYAPALVYWDGQGAGQSVFSSTLACWRSRGAFAVYGLAWIGLNLVISWTTAMIFLLFGSQALMGVALAPIALLLSTVFYTSLYFTFADTFAADDADQRLAGS
jgi:hypothetical protein